MCVWHTVHQRGTGSIAADQAECTGQGAESRPTGKAGSRKQTRKQTRQGKPIRVACREGAGLICVMSAHWFIL